jgi:hypothetical protein
MTYGQVVALKEMGLDVEMVDDGKTVLALINLGKLDDEQDTPDLGNIFDREEEKRIERDFS